MTSLIATSYRRSSKLNAIFKDWAKKVIDEMHKAIEAKSKHKGDKRFYKNLTYRIEKNNVIIEFPEYGKWIDWGRGRGKTPPPIKSLLGWMRFHRIDESAVWAISKHIGKEGIPARPFIGIFDKRLPDLSEQIEKELYDEMKN